MECKMYQTGFPGMPCVHYYPIEPGGMFKFNCRWHRARLCGGEGRFVPNIIQENYEYWLEEGYATTMS